MRGKSRCNSDDRRSLQHKSSILGLIRAVSRDPMFASVWGCGHVLHRGVLAIFDHDRDRRILTFIDRLPPRFRERLIAAHEYKGSIWLLWLDDPPARYAIGGFVEVPDVPETCYDGRPGGDSWWIAESRPISVEALR